MQYADMNRLHHYVAVKSCHLHVPFELLGAHLEAQSAKENPKKGNTHLFDRLFDNRPQFHFILRGFFDNPTGLGLKLLSKFLCRTFSTKKHHPHKNQSCAKNGGQRQILKMSSYPVQNIKYMYNNSIFITINIHLVQQQRTLEYRRHKFSDCDL